MNSILLTLNVSNSGNENEEDTMSIIKNEPIESEQVFFILLKTKTNFIFLVYYRSERRTK
jgi:hypothetical protein